jgi:hypothetical protein
MREFDILRKTELRPGTRQTPIAAQKHRANAAHDRMGALECAHDL